MLKITKAELYRRGQSFFDEIQDVDWGDDPEPDRGSMGGRISPDGVVNENNYEEYEPSALEDPIEQQLPAGQDYRREIPVGNEELGIPEGAPEVEYHGLDVDPETGEKLDYRLDQQQLIEDGRTRHEVISFDYTNRFGQYAGTRTVEPHYTFTAGTGNDILVTFDRDQNDIRAFIIGNIHPYGVRYEGVQFEPKGKIMKGESNGQDFGTAYPTVRHP